VSREIPSIVVENISDTIESWAKRSYIESELRERILNSNVLLVPGEGYVDSDALFFPEGTEQLVEFLRENSPPDVPLEICVEDKDYKELSRYADVVFLASFIVYKIAAPIVVSLVAGYLKERLGSKEKGTIAKWSLTVEDKETGQSTQLSYEGPAEKLKEQMQEALELKAIAKPNVIKDAARHPQKKAKRRRGKK